MTDTPLLHRLRAWLDRRRHPLVQPTKINCRVFGHDWQPAHGREYNSANQDCAKCKKRRMLMSNPYPDIGQAKYEWREL